MHIATIYITEEMGCVELEPLIKKILPNFSFDNETVYKIQLQSGNVYACESFDVPKREGYILNKIGRYFKYEKGVAPLYICTDFDKARLTIGDNN